MAVFIKYILVLTCVFLAFACSSRNDFQEEGKGKIRALILELQKIRTRDDLSPHAEHLEFLFNDLVTLMIEAHLHKEAYPEAAVNDHSKQDMSDTDQLRIELNRVLRLEGGREIIEKAQETALNRLDAFYSSL